MNLMQELCNERCDEVILKIDSVYAIKLAKNPKIHGRSKHLHMRFHYLGEQVSEWRLKLKHCKRKDQVVGLLTKGVTTMTSNRPKKLMRLEALENLS